VAVAAAVLAAAVVVQLAVAAPAVHPVAAVVADKNYFL
jgi:hypothetical protein